MWISSGAINSGWDVRRAATARTRTGEARALVSLRHGVKVSSHGRVKGGVPNSENILARKRYPYMVARVSRRLPSFRKVFGQHVVPHAASTVARVCQTTSDLLGY